MLRGEPHSLPTFREALEVQNCVEGLLADRTSVGVLS
jgi:hypothetical protein